MTKDEKEMIKVHTILSAENLLEAKNWRTTINGYLLFGIYLSTLIFIYYGFLK